MIKYFAFTSVVVVILCNLFKIAFVSLQPPDVRQNSTRESRLRLDFEIACGRTFSAIYNQSMRMTLLTYFDDETEEQREEKVKKRHRHEIMFFCSNSEMN